MGHIRTVEYGIWYRCEWERESMIFDDVVRIGGDRAKGQGI
jgi:hypothetical protein